jgi:hypothetical protein
MRLVRGVVLCALVACGHSTATSSGGSAEPAHWPKAAPAPVAAALAYPLELAVAGGRVWVVASDRDVTLIEGGSTRVVKSFGWVNAIAAPPDDQGVWVSANDELGGKTSALWRVPPVGQATRVEEDVTYIKQAGVDLLVWRANEAFVRDPLGAERPLGVALDKYSSVAVAGGLIYVASREGQIARVPIAGGALETLGDVGDLLEGFDVAGNVLYVNVDRGIYTITIPDHPGSGLGLVRHTLVENLDDPRELVADGQGGVYVLTYGTSGDFWGHSTNSDGELLHVQADGHVTALASDFIGAGRIALTATNIYVTDVYGGRVLMLPR